MDCCSGVVGHQAPQRQFGSAAADRDLRRYRRSGPDASSRLLLAGISGHVTGSDSSLDIGGGVGVLAFELLAKGIGQATVVDASGAYVDAAGREARRRGHADRIRYLVGDFVSLADGIEPVDVVTMHRVVCCYPDHSALLDKAMQSSRRLVAFSYPHDRWYVRFWNRLQNLRRRLTGNEFRTFVHPPDAMEHAVSQRFRRVSRRSTLIWTIDVYVRRDAV
jgi:16S rRNA G966 N2-methylase RsmD